MKKEHDDNQYILQSVDNALHVLNLFEHDNSLSLTEIAQKLGCGKTIAFRLLFTLESRGFLQKQNGRYTLGMRLFYLGNKVQYKNTLVSLMEAVLKELTAAVNETVHLVIWENDNQVLMIDEFLPNQSLMAVNKNYSKRHPHMTSTGMAMLSTRSDSEIIDYAQNVMFEKKTQNSIASMTQLMTDIISIRECGYAVNDQLYETGVCSIAVPICKTPNTPAQLAISVSGPAARIDSSREKIINALFESAEKIKELPI